MSLHNNQQCHFPLHCHFILNHYSSLACRLSSHWGMNHVGATVPCHTQNRPKRIVWALVNFLYFFLEVTNVHFVSRFYHNNVITSYAPRNGCHNQTKHKLKYPPPASRATAHGVNCRCWLPTMLGQQLTDDEWGTMTDDEQQWRHTTADRERTGSRGRDNS